MSQWNIDKSIELTVLRYGEVVGSHQLPAQSCLQEDPSPTEVTLRPPATGPRDKGKSGGVLVYTAEYHAASKVRLPRAGGGAHRRRFGGAWEREAEFEAQAPPPPLREIPDSPFCPVQWPVQWVLVITTQKQAVLGGCHSKNAVVVLAVVEADHCTLRQKRPELRRRLRCL